MESWMPADGREVERRLAAIERRLDGLEASVQESVAAELQATSEELRRAVSELGRLLLRDLDRLTKVLAEHRDAIVERLQPTAPLAPLEPQPDALEGDAPAPRAGEEGRWRVVPGRSRRRKRRR